MYNLTFFPQAFGRRFFSDVYWTIQIEVTFYALVYIAIYKNVWQQHTLKVCLAWLLAAWVNQFFIGNPLLKMLFITEYAGHFIAGIIIYQLRKNKLAPMHIILMAMSIVLIYNRMIGFNSYINGNFHYNASYSSLLLAALILIAFTCCASEIKTTGKYYSVVKFFGAMTYPLYLIHADIGFWSHAIFERLLWKVFPVTKQIIGYRTTVIIAVLTSFAIAAIFVRYIDPLLNRMMKHLWSLLPQKQEITTKNS